jgi:[methyl-Co(III) methanol-specific corrinoid protein]:coenzyme M methyltransferase
MDWGTKTRMPVGRVKTWDTPDQVTLPDDDVFLERTAPSALLEAISKLRSQYPDVAIVGKVFGPWTLGYHVAGVENILINTRLDPEWVHGFMDALKDLAVIFGRAQIEAGIDVLIIGDHATGDLVSANCYQEFLLQPHQELVKKIGCPVVLHICGDTLDRLKYIAKTGFDCFHFDSKVDAIAAKSITQNKISLMGNVNNPKTLLYGTPEEVVQEADYAARAGVEILAPECAVPTNVPDNNLKAIVNVAKQY